MMDRGKKLGNGTHFMGRIVRNRINKNVGRFSGNTFGGSFFLQINDNGRNGLGPIILVGEGIEVEGEIEGHLA